MDINSRNILAATGGGVSGPPELIDPGRYFVVPYNTSFSQSANQLLFVTNEDPTYTAKVVYRVTVDFVNNAMYTMRFGSFVVQIRTSGAGSVRGITDNTVYGNFDIFTLSGEAAYSSVDVLKRSSTQFIVAYGRSGFTFSILVFNVDLATGAVSFVANHNIAAILSLGGQTYNSPRIGGGGNFDGNGLLSQAITTFGYQTFYSYTGPTETRYGVFTLNAAGTSATEASGITNSDNFSRPRCGTGDQGYYIISNMDGSSYYSSTSTSVQVPSTTSSTFDNAYPHQPFVGVLGTNTFASYGPNYNNSPNYPPVLSRNTSPSSAFSSVVTFPSNTAVDNRSVALQSFKGGFMFTYTDADNANRMTRYRYNGGSLTQQYVYDENGNIITGGSVNGNATVRHFQNW